MKHLLLILFFLVAGYALYQLANPVQRTAAKALVVKHGVWLVLVIAVLIFLVNAANVFPSLSIL